MEDFIILKSDLIKLLYDWRNDIITEKEVQEKAEEIMESEQNWVQYENSDPRSLIFEVLNQLESLNVQFIVKEDIEILLAFLNTPEGKETEAWRRWHHYWSKVDYDSRAEALKNNSNYLVRSE